MASTGLDLTKLTPGNGALKELAQLLFLKFYTEPNAIEKFHPWNVGVFTGDKAGGVGQFGPMGRRIERLCNPQYGNSLVPMQEKTWEIGRWAIFESLCVDDIYNTLVKYSLKSGTSVADMTGDEYIDTILMPLMEEAITKMFWRLAWFGDTAAASAVVEGSTVSGGILTAGLDADLFTTCDGFFKRLAALTAANPKQRIAIAANVEQDYEAQVSKLWEPGVASKLVSDVIFAMPAVLRQQTNKGIMLTQSVADALGEDILNNNKGSELQWQTIFSGISTATYKGQTLYAMGIWDEMIAAFNHIKGGSMDYLVNPHRIVATTMDNLWIGTSSKEQFKGMEAFFDQKDNMNYIKATDTMGTLIWQDDLCVYAY